MPLMAKLENMDFGAQEPSTLQVNREGQLYAKKEDILYVYKQFDAFDQELEEDNDMEGSRIHRSLPDNTPVLPQRSEKRSTGKLENILVNLESLKGIASKDVEEQDLMSDPHELYLSSEEEGSLSDYYEDSLIEFGASPADGEASKPTSRASSRASIENTATMVSITPAGKAQIIEICLPISPRADNLPTTSPRSINRPPPLRLHTDSDRLSVSSVPLGTPAPFTANSITSLSSLPAHKLSNLSTVTTPATHSFLASDPFSTGADTDSEDSRSTTSKTANTNKGTWRKSLSRTMSKKPSMKKMGLSHTNGASHQTLPDSGARPSTDSTTLVQELPPTGPFHKAFTMPLDVRENISASFSLPDVESKKMGLGKRMTMIGLSRMKSMKMT